jgi:hypothetical protein
LLIRQLYPFLDLFAGVVALLVNRAILLYRLLRSLGMGLSGDDRSDLNWMLGVAIITGGMVSYHLRVLIDDQRQLVGEAGRRDCRAAGGAPRVRDPGLFHGRGGVCD